MNEFEDWRRELDSDYADKQALKDFLINKYSPAFGNGTISDLTIDMFWDIYQLQICFEGFLEEMEIKEGLNGG